MMTIDMSRQAEAVDAVYEVMASDPVFAWRQLPPRDAWRRACEQADVYPLVEGDSVAGAVLVCHDGQMHTAVLPAYRGRWTRKALNTVIGAARAYGVPAALVHSANQHACRFVERVGFKPVRKCGEFIQYEVMP